MWSVIHDSSQSTRSHFNWIQVVELSVLGEHCSWPFPGTRHLSMTFHGTLLPVHTSSPSESCQWGLSVIRRLETAKSQSRLRPWHVIFRPPSSLKRYTRYRSWRRFLLPCILSNFLLSNFLAIVRPRLTSTRLDHFSGNYTKLTEFYFECACLCEICVSLVCNNVIFLCNNRRDRPTRGVWLRSSRTRQTRKLNCVTARLSNVTPRTRSGNGQGTDIDGNRLAPVFILFPSLHSFACEQSIAWCSFSWRVMNDSTIKWSLFLSILQRRSPMLCPIGVSSHTSAARAKSYCSA